MPNVKKITVDFSQTGATLYAIIRREADSFRLDDVNGSFAVAPADPYISLAEDSVIKGRYELSESRTAWNDGKYTAAVYRQAGGSPAPVSDMIISSWDCYIISDVQYELPSDIINTKIPTALTFTGSDVKATLDGEEVTPTTASKTGYALSATGIQAIWDALTSAFTTVGSIGKKLADWVVGTIDTYTGNTKQTGDAFTRLGAPAGASVSADIAAIPTTSYTSTLTALSNAIAALQTDLGDPSVAETTIYAQILVLRAYVDELETRLTAERAIKLDNLNATISSRSTLTAQQVWEYATRTLTSIGAIVADIWSYATRKLTSRNIATGEDIAKEQTLLSGVGTGSVLIPGATDDGDTITLYYGNSYDGLQFILGSAWSTYLVAGNEVYIAAKKRYSDLTMLFNVKGTIIDQPTGTVSFDLSPANMTQTPSDNYILEVQVIKPDGTVVKSAIIRRLELKDRVRK